MTLLAVGLGMAVLVSAYVYIVRESLGPTGFGLAALRVTALGLILLLVVDLPWGQRPSEARPVVLLDRSLSMAAGGQWRAALDSARRLAGSDGVLLGFGRGVGPLGDTAATDGASRLAEALAVARTMGGPVHVVTDGELADAPAIAAADLTGVVVATFVRDTVPGAALVRASVPTPVHRGDSVDVVVALATWGPLRADSTTFEVSAAGRRLLARAVPLPAPPAVVTRTLSVPTASLSVGEQVMEIRHRTAGDSVPDDDVRLRVVTVTTDPPVALVADPANPDARYVHAALAEVSGLPVRGFARVAADRWVDMGSGMAVSGETVTRTVRAAALAVSVGAEHSVAAENRGARWYWRQDGSAVRGDWYLDRDVPPSPLAGPLARIAWDSLPPLTAVGTAAADGAVLLSARLGRRGAPVPVLLARDDVGGRALETAGTGLYRWGLRGGAGGEAIRALVSAGVDWALRSGRSAVAPVVTATSTVTRGTPVSFRWHGSDPPDSLALALTGDGEPRDTVVRFGPDGTADLVLPVGVYRWHARDVGAVGTAVVERYSDELVPGSVWVPPARADGGDARAVAGRVRDRWWLFLLAVAVLAAEWAWRQRRGLP